MLEKLLQNKSVLLVWNIFSLTFMLCYVAVVLIAMLKHPFTLSSFVFSRVNDVPANPHTYGMLGLVPVWFFVWFTQKSTFKAYVFLALTVYIPESFWLLFYFMKYYYLGYQNSILLRAVGYTAIVIVIVSIAQWRYRVFNKQAAVLCTAIFSMYLVWYLVGFPISLNVVYSSANGETPLFHDFLTNLAEVVSGWIVAFGFILWAYTTRGQVNVHQ